MNAQSEVRWRLRNNDDIVGFERHMGARVWSSSDGFWWRGERLTYTEKDRCLMVIDVNSQWLFEGDVVTLLQGPLKWTLRHLSQEKWVLVRNGQVTEAPMHDRQLRRVGFNFRLRSG